MATTTPPTLVTPIASPPTPAPAVTPGWKTSEFALKMIAILLSALYAAGVIPTSGTASQVAAIAATMLGAIGYSVSRGLVKSAQLRSDATKVAARAPFGGFATLPMMAMLAIAGLAFACLAGCGARMKTAETTAIDCAKADVVAAVPSLLPTVESALSAPSTMAAALVNALLNVVAPDVLACTVKAAEAAFAAPHVGDPIGITSVSVGLANAHTAMVAHGWTYKP